MYTAMFEHAKGLWMTSEHAKAMATDLGYFDMLHDLWDME